MNYCKFFFFFCINPVDYCKHFCKNSILFLSTCALQYLGNKYSIFYFKSTTITITSLTLEFFVFVRDCLESKNVGWNREIVTLRGRDNDKEGWRERLTKKKFEKGRNLHILDKGGK